MHRKDHFLKEVQKIALLLARLLDLKKSGKETEYRSLFDDTLVTEYDFDPIELAAMPPERFKEHIETSDFSTDKLNGLAQLLYMDSGHQQPDKRAPFYKKILIIFDVLEHKHHWQSFENIGIRNIITKAG